MHMQLPHSQGVRAFFSFDMAGSTAVKSSARAVFPDGPVGKGGSLLKPSWLPLFLEIFNNLPERLAQQMESEARLFPEIEKFGVNVWRITGDEILFVTSLLKSERQFALLARVVNTVLQDMDEWLSSHHLAGVAKELGLKGVLWAAGFPIRNTVFDLRPQSRSPIRQRPSYYSEDELLEIEREKDREIATQSPIVREPQDNAGYFMREFLGPEIDLGFRLGTVSFPRRLTVSIDVAELIAAHSEDLPILLRPNFHHVGWAVLKGLYGGKPYPIIWLDYEGVVQSRTSFEENQSPFLEKYLTGRAYVTYEQLRTLAKKYLEDTKDVRIQMYILPEPPQAHEIRYKQAIDGETK